MVPDFTSYICITSFYYLDSSTHLPEKGCRNWSMWNYSYNFVTLISINPNDFLKNIIIFWLF